MAAEHVYLESEVGAVPDASAARNIQSSVKLQSRLRGCSTALDIFEHRFLAVCSKRPRSVLKQYALDLRFVDPSPEHSRHIPWRCLQTTAVLVVLAVVGWWLMGLSQTPRTQHGWLPAWILLASAAICTALLSVYRTTETITFVSVNGRARLLSIIGGLGMFRAARKFEADLVAHIEHANSGRAPPRAQLLRDEMREHYRLQERGVLSAQEYEASKVRILQQHS